MKLKNKLKFRLSTKDISKIFTTSRAYEENGKQKIPVDIDYDAISSLASEARQKLKDVRPLSMGQASRISGVNPADISILLVYIEQGKIARVSNQ